jgi:hypothetical protein
LKVQGSKLKVFERLDGFKGLKVLRNKNCESVAIAFAQQKNFPLFFGRKFLLNKKTTSRLLGKKSFTK